MLENERMENERMGKASKRCRLRDLRNMIRRMDAGDESAIEEFDEYGLAFDYVPGAVSRPGFWRYQLSTGGPGEEFRFYGTPKEKPWKVTFAFLNWHYVKEYNLKGKNLELLWHIWELFKDSGMVEATYNKAMEED